MPKLTPKVTMLRGVKRPRCRLYVDWAAGKIVDKGGYYCVFNVRGKKVGWGTRPGLVHIRGKPPYDCKITEHRVVIDKVNWYIGAEIDCQSKA